MSGEFRWIPSRLGMDMAIFYDAGKVASRREDLNFVGLEHDWGVGVRLHGPAQTPLRIEVAPRLGRLARRRSPARRPSDW